MRTHITNISSGSLTSQKRDRDEAISVDDAYLNLRHIWISVRDRLSITPPGVWSLVFSDRLFCRIPVEDSAIVQGLLSNRNFGDPIGAFPRSFVTSPDRR